MTTPSGQLSPAPERPPSLSAVLRRLFLTLFLRGRGSRGIRRETVPRSLFRKLASMILIYALFGMLALSLQGQPVFALSAYLHAMTFVLLGMYVAGSAGEVLFNRDEAEILLHRPIPPRFLLWAKVRVLVEVSLWLGGAMNLVGLVVGCMAPDGSWLYPIVHAFSTMLEALFCTGLVVLAYQFCLRWFGRERLDALMTTTQVLVAIAAVVAGQLLPHAAFLSDHVRLFAGSSWWLFLLPPAWFAGLDDAVAGAGGSGSWILAACGISVTAVVLALVFGKLSKAYETGMQNLSETQSAGKSRRWARRLDAAVQLPPLRWWLRVPAARASFLLTAKYLLRDRDVKLRVYPGLAPMLVIPFIFLLQGHRPESGDAFAMEGFGIAFVGAYLGLIPLMGITMLQYSTQWAASDLFRMVTVSGPAPICDGARRAVLLFLTLPIGILFVGACWFIEPDPRHLLLLLPGIIALPIYALWPNIGGAAVLLSQPPEESTAASRLLPMILVMFLSMAISGAGLACWHFGVFWWLIAIEIPVVAGIFTALRLALARIPWDSAE
jgi:hypothetical protein